MKKVDVEKKVSKSMIITGVVLLVMFSMLLIEKGYGNYKISYPYMNITTLVASIVLLIAAAVCVVLGFKKNQKFFEASAWCAGFATLSMLIKINHEAKPLINIATSKLNEGVYALIKINLPEALSSLGVITFYELAELVFFIYLIVLWIRTIYCINKK